MTSAIINEMSMSISNMGGQILSLKRQLAEKDAAIKRLEEALDQPKRTLLADLHNAQFKEIEWRNKAEKLQKQIEAVNETLAEGDPQPGMSARDYINWLYSVLPFLDEGYDALKGTGEGNE